MDIRRQGPFVKKIGLSSELLTLPCYNQPIDAG